MFLFDTICEDIEELITKDIKWVKGVRKGQNNKIPYLIIVTNRIHLKYCTHNYYGNKPVITFTDTKQIIMNKNEGMKFVDRKFCVPYLWKKENLLWVPYKPKDREKTFIRIFNKMKYNKKNKLSYTYQYVNYKEILK
tara:strand:- start:43 stop:453 length:411 start_codon:yes stop_codon:yes gene_type:complete